MPAALFFFKLTMPGEWPASLGGGRSFMRNALRAMLIASMTTSAVIGATVGTANADDWQTPATTCSGGDLSSGVYYGLIITGECALGAGTTVEIDGNLTLASAATFDAASMSTVRVIGDIRVGRGASLWLGCPLASIPGDGGGAGGGDSPCTGRTNDVVEGSIVADRPRALRLDGDTIWGSLISIGGGPGNTETPYVSFPVEDNVIQGDVSITGWKGAWFDFIGNVSFGGVLLAGIEGANPGSTEIVANEVSDNLMCLTDSPAAHSGGSNGVANFVGAQEIGQCAGL
jgi:hypothetical protein